MRLRVLLSVLSLLGAAAAEAQAVLPDDGASTQFRAQVKAVHSALLSSELSGKIESVRFRDGERFKKGEVLVKYDCAVAAAQLAKARAAETAAAGKLRAAQELKKLNSVSATDYEEARAGLLVARAETEVEKINVGRCTITAPYDGVVGETFVEPFEYVTEGAKLLTVYDDSAFEVEMILPSPVVQHLKIGSAFSFEVEETADLYKAEVSHVAGSVDPVSQSVKVTGRLRMPQGKKPAGLLSGMSGVVHFAEPAAETDKAL